MSRRPSRKILFRNKDILIFTLTWQPGDRSTIHRHTGSHMSLTKVMQGEITEVLFEKRGGIYIERDINVFHQNQVITDGSIYAHELSNQSNSVAVTLHSEMPPLQEISVKEKVIRWKKP